MKDVMLKVSSKWFDEHPEYEWEPYEFYFETKDGQWLKVNKDQITEIQPDDTIRDEMDSDMEESGMAQGEIESCLTHWNNKYLIIRKL